MARVKKTSVFWWEREPQSVKYLESSPSVEDRKLGWRYHEREKTAQMATMSNKPGLLNIRAEQTPQLQQEVGSPLVILEPFGKCVGPSIRTISQYIHWKEESISTKEVLNESSTTNRLICMIGGGQIETCKKKAHTDSQYVHNVHGWEAIEIKHQRCWTTHLVKLKIPGQNSKHPDHSSYL